MTHLKHRLLVALFAWFGRLQPRTRQRLGRALTELALLCAHRRKAIVDVNLRLCFPEASAKTRKQWQRQHFRALCQTLIDRGVLWYGAPKAIRAMVTLSGYAQLLPFVQHKRPVILLAPHFVGLDAAATRLAMELPSAATLYTPQRDPVINTIMNTGRTRFNDVHLVNRRDGVRGLIQHLRQGRAIYYLPDMDFGRTGTMFAPFFGIPASTLLATAQIARKWQVPVFPIFTFWDPKTGHYHVEVLPALQDFPGEDSLEAATARLNRELEQWIRRCPPQYYWVHRRFKTRPVGEKGFYR